MREDLPFEEPLPDLWSISLAVGGDLVGGGPGLEDFHVLESLQLEPGKSRHRCWRVESMDECNGSSRHVLCEHRWARSDSRGHSRVAAERQVSNLRPVFCWRFSGLGCA